MTSSATTSPEPTPVGDKPHTARPRTMALMPDGRVVHDASPAQIAAIRAGQGGSIWVDIESTNLHHVGLLDHAFHFHPLAIEDVLNPMSRAKLDAYDEYLFIVLRTVSFAANTEDPYDLDTMNLNIFLGANYVVSAHAGPSPTTESVMQMVERNPDLLARGTARVAHLLCDAAVDAYFPILDQLDEFIDGLESRVFARFDETALQDIFRVKRLVLSLRRFLAPQREIFNVLTNRPTPLLPAESQLYFRDVYDHVLRINDGLDTYRELLSGTLDSYLTQVSNRLGMITKGLSVIATLSVPFVVISGMWGMNFEHIPLHDHPGGFWLMLVIQAGLGVGLLAMLRRWKLI